MLPLPQNKIFSIFSLPPSILVGNFSYIQKIERIDRSNNITLEYISNRKACMGSLKDIGKKVHRSIIHNIPNLETTKYHSPMKRINESPVIQWHTIQLRKRDCDCTKTPLINLTNTLRKRSQI